MLPPVSSRPFAALRGRIGFPSANWHLAAVGNRIAFPMLGRGMVLRYDWPGNEQDERSKQEDP